MVRAILDVSQALRLETIAEGAEDERQLEALIIETTPMASATHGVQLRTRARTKSPHVTPGPPAGPPPCSASCGSFSAEWKVLDVVAHLIMGATMTGGSAFALLVRNGFNFNRAWRAPLSPAALVIRRSSATRSPRRSERGARHR